METGLRGRRAFTRGEFVRAAIVALAVFAPATAFAHTVLVTPPPRSTSDALKSGPCGGVARTASATQFAPGSTITVKWNETVPHSGCFDILFSPDKDQNWVRLARLPDDAGAALSGLSTTVQLPNTPCTGCTLGLRQIMLSSDGNPADATRVCTATDPDSMDGGAPTYYSCADIQLVAGGDGGMVTMPPGSSSGGTSTSSSGGSSTSSGGSTGTDAGAPGGNEEDPSGPADLHAGQGGDCSVGWGAAPGASAFVAGLAALILARRRRTKKRG